MKNFSSRASTRFLWAGLVVADATAQLLFKGAATRLPAPGWSLAWIVMVAQSWRVWTALACLVVTFALWMLILRRSRLGQAFPVTALAFAAVVAGSWWFLGETVTPAHGLGIGLIIVGVAMLRPFDE